MTDSAKKDTFPRRAVSLSGPAGNSLNLGDVDGLQVLGTALLADGQQGTGGVDGALGADGDGVDLAADGVDELFHTFITSFFLFVGG